MDAEANKAQKRRYIEAFNAQDLDMIDELFDSRYVLHVPGSPDVEGPETLKQIVAESLATLSEAVLTVDDMVAEGNRVATRWTMTAIHSGNFMGVHSYRWRRASSGRGNLDDARSSPSFVTRFDCDVK